MKKVMVKQGAMIFVDHWFTVELPSKPTRND